MATAKNNHQTILNEAIDIAVPNMLGFAKLMEQLIENWPTHFKTNGTLPPTHPYSQMRVFLRDNQTCKNLFSNLAQHCAVGAAQAGHFLQQLQMQPGLGERGDLGLEVIEDSQVTELTGIIFDGIASLPGNEKIKYFSDHMSVKFHSDGLYYRNFCGSFWRAFTVQEIIKPEFVQTEFKCVYDHAKTLSAEDLASSENTHLMVLLFESDWENFKDRLSKLPAKVQAFRHSIASQILCSNARGLNPQNEAVRDHITKIRQTVQKSRDYLNSIKTLDTSKYIDDELEMIGFEEDDLPSWKDSDYADKPIPHV